MEMKIPESAKKQNEYKTCAKRKNLLKEQEERRRTKKGEKNG